MAKPKKGALSLSGQGQVRVTQRTMLGMMQTTKMCERCLGKGKIIKEPCEHCQGVGKKKSVLNREVEIPAGEHEFKIMVVTYRDEKFEHHYGWYNPEHDLYFTDFTLNLM